MFVDSKDLIVLKIFYKKNGRSFTAYVESDFIKADFTEEEKAKYKSVEIKMKPLNWGLYNELQDLSWTLDPKTNQRKFNYRAYKENRLISLIVQWDATSKNEKGEIVPMPVTKENIMTLSPDVAEAILEAYDSISTLTEEEEKKIIRQAMPYFSGKTSKAPAELTKYLIERDLINQYHWLPQDIEKIPYKWIQKYYFIEKIKNEAIHTQKELDKIMAPLKQKTSSKRGQFKRK